MKRSAFWLPVFVGALAFLPFGAMAQYSGVGANPPPSGAVGTSNPNAGWVMNPDGTPIEGADPTSSSPPTGSGVRGWQANIWAVMNSVVRANDTSATLRQQVHEDTLATSQAGSGLKVQGTVADSNSSSYTLWPTVTAVSGTYTPPAGTRKLVANVTVAGNVVLTDRAGNVWTVPLGTGSTEINAVPASFTTTATAVFLAVQ